MEKTGEMDVYLYVDGRGRMTMPRALRSRTGMGKNSFVRARLDGGVVRLTHVTPREAAQMTEEELLDFIRASVPRLSAEGVQCVTGLSADPSGLPGNDRRYADPYRSPPLF